MLHQENPPRPPWGVTEPATMRSTPVARGAAGPAAAGQARRIPDPGCDREIDEEFRQWVNSIRRDRSRAW